MGMSTRVIGYVFEDDVTYQKHKKVLIACNEAGIKELPKETSEYFGHTYPELCALDEKLEVMIPTHEINEDMVDGYEIIVSEIPRGTYKIRFTNSY